MGNLHNEVRDDKTWLYAKYLSLERGFTNHSMVSYIIWSYNISMSLFSFKFLLLLFHFSSVGFQVVPNAQTCSSPAHHVIHDPSQSSGSSMMTLRHWAGTGASLMEKKGLGAAGMAMFYPFVPRNSGHVWWCLWCGRSFQKRQHKPSHNLRNTTSYGPFCYLCNFKGKGSVNIH